MSTIQQLFANPATITINLDGASDGAFIDSDVIDNTVNKYVSADIQVTVVPDFTPNDTGYVKIYLMRSLDNIVWDGLTEDCTLLAVWTANNPGTAFTYSIDTDVVGNLPPYWKLLVENRTGINLFNGGNGASFVGKKFEIV
jgi:hypothetical protein